VKNLIKAVPILAALVLLLSYLGFEQTRLASAQTLGSVSIVSATATSTAISYATVNGNIAVKVVDPDLTGTTTAVTLFSTSDSTGFDLTLTGSSGTYVGTATMTTGTTSSTAKTLKVADGDTVSARYSDASPSINRADTISVETAAPTISALSPSNATITSAATQLLSVNITDALSGVDATSIKFLVGTAAIPATEISPDATATITDGVSATLTLGLTGVNYIGVKASDLAGNTSTYDQDEDTTGNQGNKLTVDTTAPTLSSSATGNYWDVTAATTKTDLRSSIEVLFVDDLTNLKADSVEVADFSVAGYTVSSVAVYTGKPKSAFLTLSADLLPNAKPIITIVGNGIQDEASNALTAGSTTPSDALSPVLTITSVTPTLAVKDTLVVITVTSDEILSQIPTVKVSNLTAGTTTTLVVTAHATLANTWQATTAKTASTGGYNVWATGQDSSANTATAGVEGGVLATTGAVTYQGDVVLPAPTVTPASASTSVTRNPFYLTIDYSAEATEYTGDSSTTVTITALTLDAVSVLGQESTQDNKKFLLAITDITAAEHTVVVTAADGAGNTLESTITFTVTAKPDFSLALSPGWNLISLPGSPAATAINTVLASNADVTAVVTYDASLPGGSLSAIRGDDGLLAGTLTDIDGSHAYWLLSTSFKALTVSIPSLAAGQAGVLPPTLDIKTGWNQIPVMDVVGGKVAGDNVNAVEYLSSLGTTVSRMYWFDTVANAWVVVDHDNAATNLQVGRGYFVYATKDGVLVP
jgi:hypothetical protein